MTGHVQGLLGETETRRKLIRWKPNLKKTIKKKINVDKPLNLNVELMII